MARKETRSDLLEKQNDVAKYIKDAGRDGCARRPNDGLFIHFAKRGLSEGWTNSISMRETRLKTQPKATLIFETKRRTRTLMACFWGNGAKMFVQFVISCPASSVGKA